MRIQSEKLLEELSDEVKIQINFVNENLIPLDNDQLNKRPESGKWSILECVEHLNRYAEFYIEEFEKKVSNGKSKKSDSFRSGILGNYFVKSMLPKDGIVTNKMRTMKSKDPIGSDLSRDLLRTHLDYQMHLLKAMDHLKDKDLNGNKVPTTLGNWLKIKLGDSLRFYVAHQTRHYVQLQNVLSVV